MKHKFLSLLLALALVLGLAATVSAAGDRITSGDWTYQISEGKAVILDYTGTDADVVVPAELDGYAVSEIGTVFLVFSDAAETMTSVTVSEGIEVINIQAFKNCTALEKVVLPGTVRYIGSSAFEGCTALSEVQLSEGLETIHRYAFLNTALTSIFIPASVTELSEDSIGYTGEWGDTDRVDGFTIYGYSGTAAQDYAERWRFGFVDMGANYDNSGRCGDSAYWEYAAATGTLRIYGHGGYLYEYDEVDQVPWFVHMPFITNVVVEDVLDICGNAFHGCANLTTVTMNDRVENIRTAAFKNTPKLTDIKLSASLKSISTNAFSHSGLTAIELPENLISIGTHAFEFTPLTAIEIPDSVTSLAQGAFYNCAELADLKLPASMEEIPPLAFEGCTSLKTVELPQDLIVIGRQAFASSGITAIEMPDSVVALGDNAFLWCQELEYVKLSADLEEVGWRCISECPKLATIVMPEGIPTNFGEMFFLDCDSLTDISFHTSPIIGIAMYQDCDGLTSLTIPACVTTISDRAFAYCDNLSYVTVPEGVTRVGVSAFTECPELDAIFFRGDAPAFHEAAFQETAVTCYYPADNATWTEEVRQSYGGEVTWLPYEVLPFTDVPVGSFCYEPVAWAVENGITNGVSDTQFNPTGLCQRGQIVTFLWRAAGCPEPTSSANPFSDLNATDFYYDAVLWAVENGITTGTSSTTFSPFRTCTRAEVVTFLWRYVGCPAVSGSNPFADVKDTDFYYDAVLWAVENGITNGMDAAHFAPLTLCNRAQVVTFLYRAKDIPRAEPVTGYTFELRSNDPTEELGMVYCEGTTFAAGESVIFYAEPMYGYLVEFSAEPDQGDLELYYLGAGVYELVMPAYDVTITASFVPAQGKAHTITTDCVNGFSFADCDFDEDYNDFAKPGELVLLYIVPDEGFTFSPEGLSIQADGQSWDSWWYLGELVEDDPELGQISGIFLVEMVMPDADVHISITCTPGADTNAAQVRVPVSIH